MAEIQDGIGALAAYIKAQSDISTLLSTRVFGLELPEAQNANMPRKAIVINHAGGIGNASLSDINKLRLDFFCYGETPFQAQKTWRTLKPILRDMAKNVSSSTFLYSATHDNGPIYFRDQETDWPVVVDTWRLSMQETIVS